MAAVLVTGPLVPMEVTDRQLFEEPCLRSTNHRGDLPQLYGATNVIWSQNLLNQDLMMNTEMVDFKCVLSQFILATDLH